MAEREYYEVQVLVQDKHSVKQLYKRTFDTYIEAQQYGVNCPDVDPNMLICETIIYKHTLTPHNHHVVRL